MKESITREDVDNFGWNSADGGMESAVFMSQLNLIGCLLIEIRDLLKAESGVEWD